MAAAFIMLMFLVAGCATPIGTRHVGVTKTYDRINLNAIREKEYSSTSALVLHRFFLEEDYRRHPEWTISVLHNRACEDDRRDLLYTLAELSYLNAGRALRSSDRKDSKKAMRYYMSSAAYAYLYLLGERGGPPPGPYDRNFRVACDFYNTALARLLELNEGGGLFDGALVPLAVGSMRLAIGKEGFPYPLDHFEKYLPADTLSVYGLTVRDRRPGLGAPFIAVEKKKSGVPVTKTVPGTLFLRVRGDIRDMVYGLDGGVEIYSSYVRRSVAVGDRRVPLETDLSAQLAQSLNQPFIWEMGSTQFFRGKVVESGIYPLQPYTPGRIPVVFVHGTFSSPVWWAEMFNTLRSDPLLWKKYQFWCYLYDSSKPIVFSAVDLRNSIAGKVKTLDPEGKDRALKEMVVIGHSQGGLLTKLTATETGDAIVRAVAEKPLDELNLDDESRALIDKYMVYSPLASVRRVVFISTPHRGSFLASGWVRRIVKKMVSLPGDVLKTTGTFLKTAEKAGMKGVAGMDELRTSVDSMSPESPGLLALADIPLAPGIPGHSIIGIKGDEQPPEGDDGVVKYTSAHVDYVESEFIVRSGHSSQSHPLVIEEVRRILMVHIDRLPCAEDGLMTGKPLSAADNP